MKLSQLPSPLIKVCGITNPEDARHAVETGALMLGFVVAAQSPRGITTAEVAHIVDVLPTTTPTVLVTVGEAPDQLASMATEAGVDYVQLCGDELPGDFKGFPFPILKRIGVTDAARDEMLNWSGIASAFVLDHPSAPGGTGKTVDLTLAADLASNFPCLLAGGLSGANVAEATAQVRPLGVDASSRLEASPGQKNHDEVSRFITTARAALEAQP